MGRHGDRETRRWGDGEIADSRRPSPCLHVSLSPCRPSQIDPPIPRGTDFRLVDHINHVGLGSDFDGTPLLPEQLEDVSTYPVITQILLDRGYKAEGIKKVLGGNAFRAMKRAEEAARGIQGRK